ncbi:MAG: hypothetical protein HY665_02930 [Chloroflexi bacterium]|nr:hypothetical protein [Chloroflexota bacterium]
MTKRPIEETDSKEGDQPQKIPLGQVLLDDVFFLVALGLGIPLLLYIVWAIFDLTNIPVLTP